MWRKRREQKIARVSDGEEQGLCTPAGTADPDGALSLIRKGAAAARRREGIADAQFPAFLDGVRARIAAEERRPAGFAARLARERAWAVVSLTSAALIVAVSAFLVFAGETPNAGATVVEEVSTEIDGASVHWDTSEDGATVVWVEMAERDLL